MMMSNHSELDLSNPQEVNLIPLGELILEQLGINSATVKAMKQGKKRSNYRAVINWLTIYKPNPNTSNLEKVKGLLEAFYHLSQLEEWEKACQVISVRINTPTNEELHRQLGTWQYYQEQINIYSILFEKINSDWDAICYQGLGNAKRKLGEWKSSKEHYEQQ